jgi:hypothetical protein
MPDKRDMHKAKSNRNHKHDKQAQAKPAATRPTATATAVQSGGSSSPAAMQPSGATREPIEAPAPPMGKKNKSRR